MPKNLWLMDQMLAPVFALVALDFRRNRFQKADLEGALPIGFQVPKRVFRH
jgi:hypothetical protein